MACFENGTIIDLAAREMLQLPDFRGTTLRVTRGLVWITQQDDTQDIVLRAGDNWVVERNGLTIVEAQERTTLCALGRGLLPRVAAGTSRGGALPAWWSRIRDALATFFATPTRNATPYV